ncbi:class A beta-lactamase [Curtobacterium sp. MCLR17_007]|uniref:class A beta-lactamase n=1 Tax=Curtobacterium sp. MCLR17_007 TaxID=2175648 RepID=UPI000DA8ED0D|nr:class A beta-lactamase [Curtobacterium sp. MCLR17_007]WIB59473.1 class A beta-lactamase [Curtobacterium sp. MCLR17_007]
MRATTIVSSSAIGLAVVLAAAGCSGGATPAASTATSTGAAAAAATTDTGTSQRSVDAAFRQLERQHDARLGVMALDTGSGQRVAYRSGERFAFASTNKVFIVAAVLAGSSDADLDTVVHYDRGDLLSYAPVTSRFVDSGMTVRELVDATLRFSDNTAANLLVERVGGPDAVERYLRGIGDHTTNVDRLEPELNEATPGDPRDTTTPAQFVTDLRKVLLGTTLDTTDRTFLRDTMLDNTTGAATVRAGVDPTWPVADKTGTGEYGVRNDIAVVYPAGRAPVVVVVMTSRDQPDATTDDALVAAATKAAVGALR